MFRSMNRRGALKVTAALGAATAVGASGPWGKLPAVLAQDAAARPRLVQLDPAIEPLVQLVEQTTRAELLEVVAARIRSGTTYQEVLAALQLAALRNVQPRPAVGFKFHAVLVVNAAHLASLASPDSERWLPIFWALDYFKGRQEEEQKSSGWKLGPPDESKIPAPHTARGALVESLDRWDAAAADSAAAGFARGAGTHEIFELLFRYGARDYRSIGHKAIYVANCQRTLAAIGPQHAEPMVRGLVYALLNHQGEPNPAMSDLPADRPGRRNRELARTIPAEWRGGTLDAAATRLLLDVFRQGSDEEAATAACEQLKRGIGPQAVWDAIFVGSAELLARQPGIIGLHTLTTANALRYAFDTAADDETRRWLLLQGCSFVPLFRQSAAGRGALRELTIDTLAAQDLAGDSDAAALEEIFAEVSRDRLKAAGKTLAYLARGGSVVEFMHAARRLVFLKGSDAHDYKFSSAVLEDLGKLSSPWRAKFLAATVFNLQGSAERDNGLVERTRAAFRRPNAGVRPTRPA